MRSKLPYLLLGLGLAAAATARRTHRYSFRGQNVVICGGSRGLGLVLARKLVDEGATVAILARDPDELERAQSDLQSRGGVAFTHVCDMAKREDVEAAINAAALELGSIDVLINNAGIIQVAPFDNLEEKDFDDAFAVHLYGPLYAIQAALPYMRKQGGGRILNVSSIGGQIGVPHMIPYSASKFALVGFSQALGAELRQEGIRVTVVCPGLMRTGSHKQALFRGQHSGEFAWFAALDSMPLISMRAGRSAEIVLNACRQGRAQVTFPWHWRAAAIGAELLPGFTACANGLFARALPDPNRVPGPLKPGFESRGKNPPGWLTFLADRASRKNNEERPA